MGKAHTELCHLELSLVSAARHHLAQDRFVSHWLFSCEACLKVWAHGRSLYRRHLNLIVMGQRPFDSNSPSFFLWFLFVPVYELPNEDPVDSAIYVTLGGTWDSSDIYICWVHSGVGPYSSIAD